MSIGKFKIDFKWYKKSKKVNFGGFEKRSLVLIKHSLVSLLFLLLFFIGQNGYAKDL
ncbi:MAG: hypothetical protein ACI8PD_002023, partial [Nitrospinales bacterium]